MPRCDTSFGALPSNLGRWTSSARSANKPKGRGIKVTFAIAFPEAGLIFSKTQLFESVGSPQGRLGQFDDGAVTLDRSERGNQFFFGGGGGGAGRITSLTGAGLKFSLMLRVPSLFCDGRGGGGVGIGRLGGGGGGVLLLIRFIGCDLSSHIRELDSLN
jgi:hypothetical protein